MRDGPPPTRTRTGAAPGTGPASPDPPQELPEEFPEIPPAAALWPMALGALLVGLLGLALMFQPVGPRPGEAAGQGTASPEPAPSGATPSPPANEPGRGALALVDSGGSTFASSAYELAGLARKFSQGALDLEILPDGRIGARRTDEMEILARLQAGTLSMGLVSTATLSNLQPRIAILDLPFLLSSYAQADQVLDGPTGRALLKGLGAQGLVGLGYLETGFRILSSNRPLPDLGSLKGRRVRVMQSATCIRFIRALGAEPVPSPVDRIYEMGRQGFIDAADRSYPTYWDFQLYDVHRFITDTRHAYGTKVLLADKRFWDRLPSRSRAALQEAAALVERSHRAEQRKQVEEVKEHARRRGIRILTLSAQERRRFLERVKPLYQEFARAHGWSELRAIQPALALPARSPSPEKAPKKAPIKAPKKVPKKVPGRAPGKASKRATPKSPKGGPKQTPKPGPKKTPARPAPPSPSPRRP